MRDIKRRYEDFISRKGRRKKEWSTRINEVLKERKGKKIRK